jgi:hypothetical protein
MVSHIESIRLLQMRPSLNSGECVKLECTPRNISSIIQWIGGKIYRKPQETIDFPTKNMAGWFL